MTTPTFRTWLATAVAVGLLASSCGDDDSDRATDSVAPSDTDGATQEQAETIEIDEAALQAALDRWRTEVGTFGVTLSLRVPGHDDIHLASGIDGRGPDTPMPTDGTFPVGAVTQSFVAVTALQLVDEGQLSLDDPVDRWLPELPNADQITVRMLLDYTSGLGAWPDADYEATLLEDLTRTFTPEEVLAEHLQSPPIAPPGQELASSSVGYIATGLLIERLLDQDLATVIEERFTEPLALDHTQLPDSNATLTRHGWYSPPNNPDPLVDILDCTCEAVATTHWAGYGMTSTSTDMLTWGQTLFSGELLGDDTTATLLHMNPAQPPPLTNRYFALGTTGYCLETGCSPDDIDMVGAPTSRFAGWSTQLAHHPDSGTTIIIHTNTNDPDIPDLIDLPIQIIHELGLT